MTLNDLNRGVSVAPLLYRPQIGEELAFEAKALLPPTNRAVGLRSLTL